MFFVVHRLISAQFAWLTALSCHGPSFPAASKPSRRNQWRQVPHFRSGNNHQEQQVTILLVIFYMFVFPQYLGWLICFIRDMSTNQVTVIDLESWIMIHHDLKPFLTSSSCQDVSRTLSSNDLKNYQHCKLATKNHGLHHQPWSFDQWCSPAISWPLSTSHDQQYHSWTTHQY